MLSAETGSSFCLKQTLGAPDTTESYALSLRATCPRRDPALPVSIALPSGGKGVSVAQAGAGAAEARRCVTLQCPHFRRAGGVSDRPCLASLEGSVGSNKAGVRDVSVCGAHAAWGGEMCAVRREQAPHVPFWLPLPSLPALP